MSSTVTKTKTETTLREQTQNPDELVLRLTTPASTTEGRPHVSWTTETVDNEGMDKKKSKCCCIYKKRKNWQDSSSDSDSEGETDHCRGHVDKKPSKKSCGPGCEH